MPYDASSDEDSCASLAPVDSVEFPKRYQLCGAFFVACGLLLLCVGQTWLSGKRGGNLRASTLRREQDSNRLDSSYWGDGHGDHETNISELDIMEPAPESALEAQDTTYWNSGLHRYMTVYHQTS